jgi:rhodanese-related sulfurtransferase
VDTHLHADFVSGSRELAAHGAELLAPEGSQLAFPHRPLHDGDELDLGGLTLRVIATPGHTPEHLAYLLLDGAEPKALFSGGTLMTGGVARTDLLTPEDTEPLARAAYKSIRDRLFTLPDHLTVYPTHGAGSFCSIGSGSERTTTIGTEKRFNPLLAGNATEEEFVTRLLAGYGTFPSYFMELREVNRQGPSVFGSSPPPLPLLTVVDLEAALAQGAELVDARSVDAFAAGHIPGSLSNPWRNSFATWLGWLVPRQTPVVFVTDETVDLRDLTWAALTVGQESMAGVLAGGVPTWQEAGRPVERIEIVGDPDDAGSRIIVDVRQASEYEEGHHPSALHLELGSVTQAADSLPAGDLLLHCGHGERAMTAASLIARAGRRDVAVFKGGPEGLGSIVAWS